MKKILALVLSLFVVSMMLSLFAVQMGASSSEPPVLEWDRTYGGVGDDVAWSVVQTNDGGYAIAGWTESFGAGAEDFWLIKTDSAGNVQWNKTYGGTSTAWYGERAYCLIQTSDGGYAIAGETSSFGAGSRDFWLVKMDANGNMQWNQTYGGTKQEEAYSVIQTSDGGYAIAGRTLSFGVPGYENMWLVKTDSNGTMEWNKTYGGAGIEIAYSVVQTSDGGYAIGGETGPWGNVRDVWLVKTDSNGNMQWNKKYGVGTFDVSFSMVQTTDGGYAIAGHTEMPAGGFADVYLVKTDADGTMQWNKTYGGLRSEQAWSAIQTSDEGYLLAGGTYSFGTGSADFWLVKTDANGNMQWNKTYGGAGTDWAYSVIQTSDGGYAIAGWTESFGAGGQDFWLIKLAWDRTPPTTTIDLSGNLGLEDWFVSDVTVTLTATDDISGVAETWYRIDENLWNTYEQPFIITTEGTSTVYYYSTDDAGNVEETKSETLRIDKTPPTVTILSPVAFEIYAAYSDEIYDFMATDNLDPLPAISAVVYDFEENVYSYPRSGDSLPDESGVYRLFVTATDEAGHTSTQEVIFVVYDQSAGFATGGGWINPEPEEGDYKATFGFVAKYHKGSTTPNGNLEFQYNYRDINLKSTEIEWLVISNNKAIFQGTATINGEGLYTFRVQATDGDLTGDQPDNFMIKIWEGTDTDADPIHDYKGDLAGGNIKIHK